MIKKFPKTRFGRKKHIEKSKFKSFILKKRLQKYIYISNLIIIYILIELFLKSNVEDDKNKITYKGSKIEIQKLINDYLSRVSSDKNEIDAENSTLNRLLYLPEYPKDPKEQTYYKNQILDNYSKTINQTINKVDTIVVDRNSNFGNAIVRINNVLFYCEIMGCNKIILYLFNSNVKWPIKEPIYIKKLNLTIMLGPLIDDNSFHKESYLNIPKLLKPQLKIHYIKESIVKYLPEVNIYPDELYIHIRGGDIFLWNPFKDYAQPPLCFYEKIINNNKFKHIYIISEDRSNPVLNALINKHNDIIFNKHNKEYDISLLVHAYNIVGSTSSFLISSIKFNDNLKNFWEYDIYKLSEKFQHLHHHLFKYDNEFNIYTMKPSDIYADKMFRWSKSESQLKLMLEDNCPYDFVLTKQNK